jgi:effector-binding domain-containing protein
MIEKPEITVTKAVDAAVIHVDTPRSEIQTAMHSAITELMETVNKQGIGPAGPLFAHHTRQSDTLEFDVGVPVSGPVKVTGRVKAGGLPAATVVRSVYTGGYEGLHSAWATFQERVSAELGAQMTERGLTPGATFWETYVQGPETDPNPDTFRTELILPFFAA